MTAGRAPETPIDPRWLDQLAAICSELDHGTPRLDDLYLEHRLELRMTSIASAVQVEECRTEGVAARWRLANRTVLHAASGISAQVLSQLLGCHGHRVALSAIRPAPIAELDPPRDWHRWARDAAARSGGDGTVVRFLHRRAVVVGPGRWSAVVSPPLVRIEAAGATPAALLAVWDHPQLSHWIGELGRPVAGRAWCPSSGLQVPVVMAQGTAGVLLHELIGHPLESDLVLSGRSPLASLGGATATSTTIQVIDDPKRFDLPGGFGCDDEGIAAEPVTLVERGQLVGWLCDRNGWRELKSAPGRGRRASWDLPPAPRLSNLVVSAGDTDPEDLERDLKSGLLVTRVGRAGVDPLSGRVLVRVERGWEIWHGRRRRQLVPFELTGGSLEVLANLDPTLGNDP